MSTNNRIFIRDLIVIDDKSPIATLDAAGKVVTNVIPERSDTDEKLFKRVMKTVQNQDLKMPVLLTEIDATHYGYINANRNMYDPAYLKQNAKTFTTNYVKPTMVNHESRDTTKVIGRIVAAVPVKYKMDAKYTKRQDVPKGHIKVFAIINDFYSMMKVMDGRYLTVSIGGFSDDVRCSICGYHPFSSDCEHTMGQSYKDEDGKKKVAYRVIGKMEYSELSYVAVPADVMAKTKRYEIVSPNSSEAKDVKEMIKQGMGELSLPHMKGMHNDSTNFLIGSSSELNDGRVLSLLTDSSKVETINPYELAKQENKADFEGDQDLEDVIIQEVNVDDSSEDDTEAILPEDSEESDDTDTSTESEDCPCCGDIDDEDLDDLDDNNTSSSDENDTTSEEATYMLMRFAKLNILASLIEHDSTNAIEYIDDLASCGIIFPMKDQVDGAVILKAINDEIDRMCESDAKLTPKKRKKLPESVFCGPDRSWPVPDCQHVATARAYLKDPKKTKNLTAAQKKRVKACVERKAKALGCDKDKEDVQQTTTSTEETMSKFTFNTVEELLNSQEVQSHIDSVVTPLEQKMSDLEERLKSGTVDQIVALSTKLDKPLMRDLKTAESPEDKSKALDEIKNKLKGRTVESLCDSLEDLRLEEQSIEGTEEPEDSAESDIASATARNLDDNSSEDTSNNDTDDSQDDSSENATDNSVDTTADGDQDAGQDAVDENNTPGVTPGEDIDDQSQTSGYRIVG